MAGCGDDDARYLASREVARHRRGTGGRILSQFGWRVARCRRCMHAGGGQLHVNWRRWLSADATIDGDGAHRNRRWMTRTTVTDEWWQPWGTDLNTLTVNFGYGEGLKLRLIQREIRRVLAYVYCSWKCGMQDWRLKNRLESDKSGQVHQDRNENTSRDIKTRSFKTPVVYAT